MKLVRAASDHTQRDKSHGASCSCDMGIPIQALLGTSADSKPTNETAEQVTQGCQTPQTPVRPTMTMAALCSYQKNYCRGFSFF